MIERTIEQGCHGGHRRVDVQAVHRNVKDVDRNGANGGTVVQEGVSMTIPGLNDRGASPSGSSRGDDLPGIYADAAWEKMGNIILSTSNCGNPSLRLFGFGPVSADGTLFPEMITNF